MAREAPLTTLQDVLLGLEVEIAFALDDGHAGYLAGWRDALEKLGGAGLVAEDSLGRVRLRLNEEPTG